VSGQDKLLQDLKLWVLERIGTDPATPTYGSRLDGGVINGEEVPTFIGMMVNERVAAEIRSEVISLLQRYQAAQYEKLREETILYVGKNTLDASEIIQSIDSVRIRSESTTIIVSVHLTTLANQSLNLTFPVAQGL
jgi:hypothetical protein